MTSQTRKLSFIGLAFVLALLLSAYTLAPNRASAQSTQAAVPATSSTVHFIQIAYAATLSGDSTYLNNINTNNKPNALLFVTPNLTPFGVPYPSDPHPVGVWYNTSLKEWAIFNEDKALMPLNAAFNVMVVAVPGSFGGTVFVQTAAPYNISFNSTYIQNVITNGNPPAQLLITQNYNPGGIGGMYNPHHVGVWYNNSLKEWAIFNQDKATMTSGVNFNVMVGSTASGGGKEFLQTTTSLNRSGNATSINNPATNGLPNGVLFVTANWNPGGIGGTYDPHPVAVQYNTGSGEWMIVNEDGSTMLLQAAFNVIAFAS
jgi:hypothetical protein